MCGIAGGAARSTTPGLPWPADCRDRVGDKRHPRNHQPRIGWLILPGPTNAEALGQMIRRSCEDERFRSWLGQMAHETAGQYTWERNTWELASIFEEVLRKKSQTAVETLAHESCAILRIANSAGSARKSEARP